MIAQAPKGHQERLANHIGELLNDVIRRRSKEEVKVKDATNRAEREGRRW